MIHVLISNSGKKYIFELICYTKYKVKVLFIIDFLVVFRLIHNKPVINGGEKLEPPKTATN